MTYSFDFFFNPYLAQRYNIAKKPYLFYIKTIFFFGLRGLFLLLIEKSLSDLNIPFFKFIFSNILLIDLKRVLKLLKKSFFYINLKTYFGMD